MLTSKNLLAGLGAFAGLGVALMPLSNVSATEPNTTTEVADGVESDAHEVKARVGETLSIQVTEAYDNTTDQMITLGAGTVADNFLKHTVNVKGNTKNDYTLTIAAGANGNAMKHENAQSTATIPAGTTLNETTSAWGYKYSADDSTYDANYSAVPASGATSLHAANGTKVAAYDENHYVKFGVSAAEDQLSGIYTAEVVYKASAVSAL